MADHMAVKMRGLEINLENYQKLTTSDDHPYGEAAWAGDATEAEQSAWQAELDNTGSVPPEARLTRDETGLARWIAYFEEVTAYTNAEKEPPKRLLSNAQKCWDKPFSEPKTKQRQRTIQMYLALPAGRTEEYGGHPEGILWSTLEAPMTVEEVGRAVSEAYPDKKYKEDFVNRAKIDIQKFNKGVFPCQGGLRPPTEYPLLGLPEKKKKSETDEEGVDVEAATATIG